MDETYYKREIARVGFNHVSIKLFGDKDETRVIDLNKQSIKDLQDYLTELEQKLK